MSSAALADIHF